MLPSVLLLLLVSHTEAGYIGVVSSYSTKDLQDDKVSMTERWKYSYSSCDEYASFCSGCSKKIEERKGEWCLREATYKRPYWKNRLYNSYWTGSFPGTWTDNRNNISSVVAMMYIERRNRSDINKPNSSPHTGILPVVRVPSNCQRNISLMAFDPDGDEVKCRFPVSSECNTCTPPSVLTLSSSCTLSFSPTNSGAEGPYAVQLMMEDFVKETITLSQFDGSTSLKGPNSSISSIPIQFLLKVDPAAPSCTEGEYLPRFLPPTPEHGAQIFIKVNQTVEISIRAEATQSVITELLFSGPFNVVKISSGIGHFTLRWTPSTSEDEGTHPICFVVHANGSSSVFQSEHRCVVVTVGNSSTTIPPPKTSHLTVLKLKFSTTMPLKDNHDRIVKAIKDELIRRGMPPDINVCLLSDGSLKVTKTAAP